MGVWDVLHWGCRDSTPFAEIFFKEGFMIPHFLEYLKGFLALAMPNSFSTPLVVLSVKHSSKGDSRACSTILCMYMSPSLPVREVTSCHSEGQAARALH